MGGLATLRTGRIRAPMRLHKQWGKPSIHPILYDRPGASGTRREASRVRQLFESALFTSGPHRKYEASGIGVRAESPQHVRQDSGAIGAPSNPEEETMLRWALAFFIIAIIAAIFGFAGIAAAAAGIAKILFFIFIVLFLIALVGGLARRA